MSAREIGATLRVVVADDERPARAFLMALLRGAADVEVVGEAADGAEAVEVIERERPDLALLDLQMPEIDGLGVVRLLRKDVLPLIAFVTAHDAFAVHAFELNAVDYLLKPVDAVRLRKTLMRAHDRLERADWRAVRAQEAARVEAAVEAVESGRAAPYLRRIPVRRRDDIVFVSVEHVSAVVADGELLHVHTDSGERHVITHRLKDLETRLDPHEFVRLSRGVLARIAAIQKVSPMPGGTFLVTMRNGQQLQVSRIRSRVVRDGLLRL